MTLFNIDKIDWVKMNNLVPAIIQDVTTSNVLMLGYMNQDALNKTLARKKVTFYSRSKKRLWTKGETSGNTLALCDISYDCDGDSLLLLVKPSGPTCHKANNSCFNDAMQSDWQIISNLEYVIKDRIKNKPKNSYTAKLANRGLHKVAQKVGEEAVEVVIAALVEDKDRFSNELADLFFHLLILIQAKGMSMADVAKQLSLREK